MTIEINGTSGVSGVDGSAGTPALQGSDTNTGISFGTDEVNINTGGTERTKVDSSGRLLVGTSSSSVGARAIFQGSSAGGGWGVVRITSTSSTPANGDPLGYLMFGDSSQTEAAWLTAERDGGTWTSTSSQPTRLVFSTTADGASSPTERMRIGRNGDINCFHDAYGAQFRTGVAAGTTYELIYGAYGATNVTNGTGCFQVFSNGNVRNTNGSYGSISDIKLKENIVDANSQWDDIKALRPVNYNFKEGQTHTQLGLIAQEVELVSPGLVYETPDRDEDGNDLGTVTKSVNYSVLYMKSVKALQEAMERIETLEAKVAALEGGAS